MTRNGPLLPILLLALPAALPAAAADVLFERANLDQATPACVDFFQHADGGWISRNPIPPSEPVWERFERLRVATNPHPLNRFRVDGSVSDLPEFAQAFGCKPGDPMARPAEERCAVW